MKFGIKFIFFILIVINFSSTAQEQKLDLNKIQPSFDLDINSDNESSDDKQFRFEDSKNNENYATKNNFSKINFYILDKITAKKIKNVSDFNSTKMFETLEITFNNCISTLTNKKVDFAAFAKIKDISETNEEDKVFLYNGWFFSSDRSVFSLEHPLYDVWIESCS